MAEEKNKGKEEAQVKPVESEEKAAVSAEKKEAPATQPEAKAPEAPSKGEAHQKKSTVSLRATECKACAKPLKRKLWYYRDGAFYCTNKCFKRKQEDERKKLAEERQKQQDAAKKQEAEAQAKETAAKQETPEQSQT